MRFLLQLFLIVMSVSADGLLCETNFVNRIVSKNKLGYSSVLQGMDLSINYVWNDRLIAGVGFGPQIMNANVIKCDTMSAIMLDNDALWLNCYWLHNLCKDFIHIGLGGKVGVLSSMYSIVYEDRSGVLDDYKESYWIEDTFYGSLGVKLMAGFRHLMINSNFLIDFGKHSEFIEDTYYSKGKELGRSFTCCVEFNAGISFLFGQWK